MYYKRGGLRQRKKGLRGVVGKGVWLLEGVVGNGGEGDF